MRKVNFKRVLDALSVSSSLSNAVSNSTNSTTSGGHSPGGGKSDCDVVESLTPENFQVCKMVRHGFPHRPTALAYDPVQNLLAIGNRNGTIRIFGQPGVDVFMTHEHEYPITQLLFLINEGGLISVCANNTIHLWNLRQKRPAILHSLEFSKERITFCHLPHTSKWLYIGTERGNLHLCNIETFQLSGYTINWNKAIDLAQKSHPGQIVGICENPWDENKILIGFESGLVVLWDLKTREVEHRYNSQSSLRHLTWHQEGKQFMCSHQDGSITLWNYRNNSKPQQTQHPHGTGQDSSKGQFRPIDKVEWSTVRNSEAFVIFSGGLPVANQVTRPSITVMKGKSVTVLEMDYPVIDFVTICSSPWSCDFQDPTSLVILLEQDLVVVDLASPTYPCIEIPHAIDLHDSPVTTLHVVSDHNSDLTPGLYQVSGNKPRRSNCSKMAWPLNGGEWSVDHCTGFPEIMVTGHADGSIRFWDASAVSLKALYKVRTHKLFKRSSIRVASESQDGSGAPQQSSTEEDPFAISHVVVCAESRSMTIANMSGNVITYVFSKQESLVELRTLDINPPPDEIEDGDSPTTEQTVSINEHHKLQRQGSDTQTVNNNYVHQNLSKSNSQDTSTTTITTAQNSDDAFLQYSPTLRVKGGVIKQSPGFKVELIMQLTGADSEAPPTITYLTSNSAHGLVVIGTIKGVAIIDTVQCSILMNMSTHDVLLSIDHKKCTKSPTRTKPPTSFGDFAQLTHGNDPGLKSPTTVQINEEQNNFSELRRKKMSAPDSSPSLLGMLLQHKPAVSRRLSLNTSPGLNRNKSTPMLAVGNCTRCRPKSIHIDFTIKPHPPPEYPKPINPKKPLQRPKSCEIHQSMLVNLKPSSPKRERKAKRLFRKPSNPLVNLLSPSKNTSVFKEFNFANDNPIDVAANGNSHTTVHRELSTSSTGSVPTKPTKRPPHSRTYKKTSSFNNDKSMESQNSVATEDGAFSRASSISDLDKNECRDIISFLTCSNTYASKGDTFTCPCLWIGTTTGYLFNIVLNIPSHGEQRETQPVMASPSGNICQLVGPIINCAFLNSNAVFIDQERAKWNDRRKQGSTQEVFEQHSPSSDGVPDKQFMVVMAEKQIKVYILPSYTMHSTYNMPSESSYFTTAGVATVQASSCLICFTTSGNITVFSLPSLNPMHDIAYLPPQNIRVAQTLCLSDEGQVLYMPSSTEIQRLSCSVELYESVQDIIGHLFIPCPSPEKPNPGFLKGLFGGVSHLDREELFGEASGKPSRAVAKHVPGSGANLEGLRGSSQQATSEMQRLRMLGIERGEKLSELEEKTQRMHESASRFSSEAHQLMLKYKNKKWYQL